MNKTISGVLCVVFFASSLMASVAQHALAQPQNRAVAAIDYTGIFPNILRPFRKEVERADTIVVVTRSQGCPPCDRWKETVYPKLKKAGYSVTFIEEADYDGPIDVDGTPYFILMKGEKVTQHVKGYQPYEYFVQRVDKPKATPVPKNRSAQIVNPLQSGWLGSVEE